MSDEDDLGGFDPTTPYKPTSKKPVVRKPTARPAAGPSTKPFSNTAADTRKNARKSPEVRDGADDVYSLDPSEEQEEGSDVEPLMMNNKAKRTEPQTVNGKATAKVNGKPKAEPPQKPSKKASKAIPMEVKEEFEMIEGSEDDEIPIAQKVTASRKARQTSTAVPLAPRVKENTVSTREFERVTKQLEEVISQRDQLTNQLKELFSIRQTEQEEALEAGNVVYETKIKAQEELIQELTSQIARIDPLVNTGQTSTLHFLTREAAEEEQRAIKAKIADLKSVIKEKDQIIKSKDMDIENVRQQLKDAQKELDAEVERSKAIASKARGPAATTTTSAKSASVNEPHHSATIQLYEDVTNLLVTGAKIAEGPMPKMDSVTFRCVYSGGSPTKSLNFSLHMYWTPKHDAQKPYTQADFDEQVQFTPLELDKESPDFVESLDFLKDTFTFSRNQMDVFLKTLWDNVGGVGADNDDDVEMVE